jgi:putative peptidoglycan lipid II flippase
MIQKFLNSQTKSISSASLILAVFYFLSALLGLFRDRLLAGTFGAGNELDVYYAAFTVPDFVALILIFGAISAAVIPIFSSYLIKSKDQAWEYASVFLNLFLGFLILICVISIIFAPYFISIIAPGFSGEKKEITVQLMRIMFLSPILLGTSNIISGILQVFHRFLVTALAPIMYNIGIITGIYFFYPAMGLSGLAWGVVFGGFLHLMIQVPAFLFSGFKYKLNFNYKHPGVFKTLKLMVPRSLGLGASQLNIIAMTAIASTLTAGSIAVFNLANNLSAILVNAVALSISTAAFPSMSMAFLQEEEEKFLTKFSSIFRQTLFLIVPISVLILILRAQIVRVVLGAGKFTWVDTKLTTACLGILAFSLFAQGLIFILSKTFYAAHNTKIPATLSALAVALNISLSLMFIWLINNSAGFSMFFQTLFRLENVKNIGIAGLALAFSTSIVVKCFLLSYLFYKKFPKLRIKEFSDSLYKILLASIFMGFSAFFARQLIGSFLPLQTFWSVFLQLVLPGAVGVIIYTLATYLLKSSELKIIYNSLLKRFLYPVK